MKRLAPGLATLAIGLLFLGGCGASKGPVVATVNGQPIYQADLNQAIQETVSVHGGTKYKKGTKDWIRLETFVLQGLIYQDLAEQKAASLGIHITSAQVSAQIEKIRSQFVTQQGYDQYLRSQGLTEASFKDKVYNQLIFDAVARKISEKDQVTQKEVRDYYNKHKKAFMLPAKIHLAQILTESQTAADDAMKALQGGHPWNRVVLDYSRDTYSIYQGGDIGSFVHGALDSRVEKAVWAAKPGSIVGPMHLPKGWYIFKVVGIEKAQPESYSDASFSIWHNLEEQHMLKNYEDLLGFLRKKAVIVYKDKALAYEPVTAHKTSGSSTKTVNQHGKTREKP